LEVNVLTLAPQESLRAGADTLRTCAILPAAPVPVDATVRSRPADRALQVPALAR